MKSIVYGIMLAGAVYASAHAGSSGSWQKLDSAFHDGVTTRVAFARSADGASLWLTCNRDRSDPALRVAVRSKRLLGRGVLSERLTSVRFDDALPTHQRWNFDRHAGGPADRVVEAKFLAGITSAKKIEVRMPDYRLETGTVVFRLQPSETVTVIAELARDCRQVSSRHRD